MSAPPNRSAAAPAGRQGSPLLPTIEIRFSPIYAWLLIGFGVIFFLLAFLVGRQNVGLAIFIAVASLGGVFGGNYWRRHLHVVARMTPRQLILQRGGTVNWTDIVAIERKRLTIRYRGSHESDYVCIKLAAGRPVRDGLEGWLDKAKTAVLGYDIVVPGSELSCTADWFVEECKKRMAAASPTTPA
jgi:hypothetical protein